MKMTIDTGLELKEIMRDYNRDHYSLAACEALLEYYDEVDPDMEVDPIAICGDCTEYGEDGAACTIDNLVTDYEYLVEDEAANDTDPEEHIDAIVDALKDVTTVLELSNGNYIVFAW